MDHRDGVTDRRPAAPAGSEEGCGPSGYEPPRVERALTPDALEREILYAGTVTGPQNP
jgi:hypothetical protein